MLLLDDDDELPAVASAEERSLEKRLGESGLHSIDAALLKAAGPRWRKVAAVVSTATDAGGYDVWEDNNLHLHVRRVIELVSQGALEAQGNLRRPRFSEVRLARGGE